MPRSKAFLSPHRPEPFAKYPHVRLEPGTARGALPCFNPTRAGFHVEQEPTPSELLDKRSSVTHVAVPQPAFNWRSRDNRKGRHALRVEATHPASTSTIPAVLRGVARIFTQCPYWDVSYLVSVSFAIGSLIFIACGLFSWLPLVDPSSEFRGEVVVAGGVTSFVGATLFEVGAVLLVFEAFNESRTGCFGWAISHSFSKEDSPSNTLGAGRFLARADRKNCRHHHQGRRRHEISDMDEEQQKWIWWPTWYDVKTHYIHEIGFVASIVLSTGATVFWITGICSLPGIFDQMSLNLARGLYWLTYLLGGVLFIVSSVLYMLENQQNWYTPAPRLLGWHVGLWNLIGSVGWTIAASFGYCTSSGCAYQSELTLIWASFAFFVGSMIQWYEALHKYPIERVKK